MPVLKEPKRRPRSRASAKKAGSWHERKTADYLKAHVSELIDRRVKTGAKDRGDIGGLRIWGTRLVVECKDTVTVSIGPHLTEAEVERGNDDALAGMVVYKRTGRSEPGAAVVVMTLADLVAMVTGSRRHIISDY